MKTTLMKLTAAAVALGLSGCATKPDLQLGFAPGSCEFSPGEEAPDWVCAPAELFPSGYWFERGVGEHMIKDHNLRYTVAMQNARIKLARRATTEVIDSYKEIAKTARLDSSQQEEVNRDILSTVNTHVELPSTFKETEIFDQQGNLHVLVKVPTAELKALIESKRNRLLREFNQKLRVLGNPPTKTTSIEGSNMQTNLDFNSSEFTTR